MRQLLQHRRRLAAAAVALGASLAGLAATPAGAAPPPPTPETCTAPVRVGSLELVRTVGGPALLVKGIKAHADARVALFPEDVAYVRAPDYWRYFVVGCGGTGPVAKVRFTSVLPIEGPRGLFGIVVGTHHVDLGDNLGAPAVA